MFDCKSCMDGTDLWNLNDIFVHVVYEHTHNLKKKKTSDCYCVSFSFGVVWLLPVVYYWWCSGGSVVVQYSWWCGVVV
jgi:hypothetical protein